MRVLAWVFTVLLLVALAVVGALALWQPEVQLALPGLPALPVWIWVGGALLYGALLVFIWLPALHLRAQAERRALIREKARLEEELKSLRAELPEEVPRIPDRNLEGLEGV